MTRTTIALTALLSVCIAVGQAAGVSSPGTSPGTDTVSDADSTAKAAELVSFLELNEGQVESLRLLEQQFEDELFPLARDSWEKEWQLRQLYRSDPPNKASADTLRQQIEALHEQVRSLGVRHREQSRALLSSPQIDELDRLERALELSRAAEDAVCANLLEAPAHYGSVLGLEALTWGPVGTASCGLGSGIPTVFGGRIERDDSAGALPSDEAN